MRLGEIVTFTAGTGIESQCREIVIILHVTNNKKYIALEENVKRSIRGIVGLELNKLTHYQKYLIVFQKKN